MISILLFVVAVACIIISEMSLYISGIYTGNKEHQKAIISGVIFLITLIAAVVIASLS
jgi:hypothetical protein